MVVTLRALIFGHSSDTGSACSMRLRLARHALRRAPQEGGREGVAVPSQISRQPFENPEAAGAVLALEPQRRHLADAPAEAMGFHQQFNTVSEALVRLDLQAL